MLVSMGASQGSFRFRTGGCEKHAFSVWRFIRMEKITFTPEDGEAVEFYVLEQTRIGGEAFLLVADSADGDGEALILRDVSDPEEPEAVYEVVEDDEKLSAVAAVFEKMMDDIDII